MDCANLLDSGNNSDVGIEVGPGQFLAFTLQEEIFCIEILHTREIIEFAQLTEVPMMPPFVRGVINLRGAVMPVLDLAARFGRTCSAVGRRTCIVIVEVVHEGEIEAVGLMVDAVNEVKEIARADIVPPPAFGSRIRSDFIAGMGRVNNKFVMILDVNRIFMSDEIAEFTSHRQEDAPCLADLMLPQLA